LTTLVQQALNKQTYKDKKCGGNLEHAPNSEDEQKYLQHLMKKYSGKHMVHIANGKNGGKNT